jgi:hypothetical protein
MKKHFFSGIKCMYLPVLAACLIAISSTACAETPDTSEPYVFSAVSRNMEDVHSLGLEEEIIVTVVNADQLIDEARLSNKGIILFFDGMPLKNVYPGSYAVHSDKSNLHFFVRHASTPIQLWNYFISTRKSGEFFTRKVSVSVGIEDQTEIPTLVKDENAFTLILVRKTWFATSIIIIIMLMILFLVLAVKSDILRDIGPNPETGQKAYSLALVQMGIWFCVIMVSWLLLYTVKHTFNTITDTLVALMGISAGTGVGGVVIDTNREIAIKQSRGFLKDIISDEYGISFHRFQILAWTIVMVVVFIRQVVSYLTMPEFDSSLLILMGISSGTYLGIKVTMKPEAKDRQQDIPSETLNSAE